MSQIKFDPRGTGGRHMIKEKVRDPSMDFHKVKVDPALFKIQVQKKHIERLENDDLDEISKFEVVYKILKDQLRNHQKHLINLKEKEKAEKRKRKEDKQKLTEMELKDFSKHIKPFELYGC